MHVYIAIEHVSEQLESCQCTVATASRDQFLHQITDNLSKGSYHL